MPREQKFATTRSDLKVTERPTERSQVFAHEIAVERSAGAGLEGLSNAFGNFFGTVGDALNKAERAVAKEQITRENFEQKNKGVADALAGKPVDASLANDYDYTDAHTVTSAKLHGDKMASDWEAYVRTLPVTADIGKEQERWLKDQVRDGSGDPLFDSHLLATFKQRADVVNSTFRANSFKTFEIKAQSDFGSEIASRAATGEATADEFQDWQSRAVPLFQGDVVKARAFVLSQMTAGARTPRALAQVDALLHAPGYDENGRSFADMFPDAAAQTSDAATDHYMKATAAPGFLAFRDASDRMHQFEMSGDLLSITKMLQPGGELDQINSKWGAEPQYQALRNRAFAALSKLAAGQVGMNQYLSVARGESLLVDQSNINKWQLPVLQRSGVDPLRSPQEAVATAAHVFSARGIADDLKATMSFALSDKANPKAQANAFTFWRSLEHTGFDVDSAMSKQARQQYGALLYASRGSNVDAAIAKVNANQSLTKLPAEAAEFDWSGLTNNVGTPKSQVYTAQLSEIKNGVAKASGLTGLFGGGDGSMLAMDDGVRNEIMSLYGRSMVEFRDAGNGNYIEDAKAWTLRAIQADYLTVPAANGKVRLMRKEMLPKQVPVTETDYSTGQRVTKMQDVIGPGKYKNHGVEENTIETFKADMKRLNEAAPFVFSDPSEFYAGYDARITRNTGRFVLYNSTTNEPVMFEPGQQISIEGETIRGEKKLGVVAIPTDPKEALEFIESRLPKEFKVEPGPYGGLMVTYGYRLTGKPTMEELGANLDAKRRGDIRATLPEDAKQAYDARQVWMESVKRSTKNAMQPRPAEEEPEAPLPTDPYWRAHEIARRQRRDFFRSLTK